MSFALRVFKNKSIKDNESESIAPVDFMNKFFGGTKHENKATSSISQDDVQQIVNDTEQFRKLQKKLRDKHCVTNEPLRSSYHSLLRERLDDMGVVDLCHHDDDTETDCESYSNSSSQRSRSLSEHSLGVVMANMHEHGIFSKYRDERMLSPPLMILSRTDSERLEPFPDTTRNLHVVDEADDKRN